MQKIAIILTSYPLGCSTMIISAAKMFAQLGHEVNIFIDEREFLFCPIDFSEKNIQIILVDKKVTPETGQDEVTAVTTFPASSTPVFIEYFRKLAAPVKHYIHYLSGAVFLKSEKRFMNILKILTKKLLKKYIKI